MPWTHLIKDDVPPYEIVTMAAMQPGYEDAPDVGWRLVHTDREVRNRLTMCACRWAPVVGQPGSPDARPQVIGECVLATLVQMKEHRIRLKGYGAFRLYLGRCPNCRTIYWDLVPAEDREGE